MESKDKPQDKKKDASDALDKIEKLSAQERTLRNLERNILKEGEIRSNVTFSKGNTILEGKSLRTDYYGLIGEKTLKKDEQLMNDIIRHRKLILQHRIYCDILLIGKNSNAGIRVFHTLIEHGQNFVNYWEGQTIDPSSFTAHVHSFLQQMSFLGVKSRHVTEMPTEKMEVARVNTSFSFA